MIEKGLIEKRIRELETEIKKADLAMEDTARMKISMQGGIIELKKLLEQLKTEDVPKKKVVKKEEV